MLTFVAEAVHYTYDAENRLTQVTYADGRQIRYGYDAMGNTKSIATVNDSAPVVLVSSAIEGPIALPIVDYQIAVNRTAGVLAFNAAGLPAGLKVNKGITVNADGKAPGVIYGTPTASGIFRVGVSARSAVGTGSPATLIINITNPFTRIEDGYDLAGKALAILPMSPIVGGELGGSVALTVAPNGSFSGKLVLGTKTYPFKGQLEGQFGGAVVTVDRAAPLADLTLSLTLGLEGSLRGMLLGTLSDGITSTALDGNVSVFGAAHRATALAGIKGATYNVGIFPNAAHVGNNAFPQGTGFTFAKVTTSGDVALTGKLADGTAFSGKSMLFRNGQAHFLIPLYKGNGVFTGTLEASDGGSVDLLVDNRISGGFAWQRLAMPGTLYAAGFPTRMLTYLAGGYYVAPAAGWRVFDLGNGAVAAPVTLTLARGGLTTPIISDVTINTANQVTAFVPNNNALALGFTPKSGLFSGKFTTGAPARTTTFQGLVLPAFGTTASQGHGYFLLPGALASDPVLSGSSALVPVGLIF